MLRKDDFKKILTDLKFGLMDQYKTLLKTDNIELGRHINDRFYRLWIGYDSFNL